MKRMAVVLAVLAILSIGSSVSAFTRNFVADGNFTTFGQISGPWGTNSLYSEKGIWWNSYNAGSVAYTVNLQRGQSPDGVAYTALYIKNPSGRSPHVYGTTAQRIYVNPGQTYEISFWASARNLASNGGLNIAVDPAWRIRPVSMAVGSYGWSLFRGTFVAQAGYIDLRIIMEDAGEVWITGVNMFQLR